MIQYENLRLVNQQYEESLVSAFRDFLNSGSYILGEQVKSFEQDFAAFCGADHCIGVASGLDALQLSLLALDLPPGSEILVPSNTYIATILSIVNQGFRPVFVEPKIETYNINPQNIETQISAKTRAIMPVHLYGKMCEMVEIEAIAQRHNLSIIEDCAQAHGASVDGKKAGTWGIGAYSFYPTKNLGALGDAGAIITDSSELSDKLRALRNYGSQQKYKNDYVGINSRLDELQAAFLKLKLRDLDRKNEYKKALADKYFQEIKHPDIILPVKQAGFKDVHHIFNIRTTERDRLRAYLLSQGIQTEIHYPIPPHRQPAYKELFAGQDFPVSELIHATTLSLPISTSITLADVKTVSDTINSFS